MFNNERSVTSEETPRFLGDLSVLQLKMEYRSLKDDPVRDFYRPCLLNSILYQRASGYFRSTVFSVVGTYLLEFVRRGGQVRLICSPELTSKDIESITLGYDKKGDVVERALIQEVDNLLREDRTSFNTRLLATLIAVGAMEIKVAIRADGRGLYHEKIGIFSDGLGNSVSFKGSANETWGGWHEQGNFESIEVFCNWHGGSEAERVRNHVAHFESLWSERDPDIQVFAFPENAAERLREVAFDSLEKIELESTSASPSGRNPMKHQLSAVDSWIAAGERGIFEHATGSGKTFTALMILQRHTSQGGASLVVVPSKLLLEQWSSEIEKEIPKAVVLLAGGGHNTWKKSHRLSAMTDRDDSTVGRIIVATMSTASSDNFRKQVTGGDHLLVVADEVHQIGSPENSKILELESGKRLGLSATPTRYGDPDGTEKIFEYFGKVIPPRISLADAIKAGRLVPYEYYPHPVSLTMEEADEWRDYTKRISREIARGGTDEAGNQRLTRRAKMLLIHRSRIAKKAQNKIQLACSVLSRSYKDGQSWLVYCEDENQLSELMLELKGRGMSPVEYHSKMAGDRKATMSWFRSFGGILLSIRCLDEGVDIPDVSHALILASSQNPRQFIQRRGRVLRKADGKHTAFVHDAIVVPVSAIGEPEQISLLRSELVRAVEFSNHAVNRSAGAELRNIAIDLGINPDELTESGVEEDNEGED